MKKYFVFGDVHSYFDVWMKALNDAGFDIDDENHIIISLGDLLDRGEQSVECLNFVNNLPDNRKILIKGNHEDLMQEAILRGRFMEHDYHNRTHKTVQQLTEMSMADYPQGDILKKMKDNELWNKYVNSCVDYYELGDNIFVHGWIPYVDEIVEMKGPEGEVYVKFREYVCDEWKSGRWEDARWYNGMELWSRGITIPNKTVWCGHWHTSWGHTYLHGDGQEFLKKIETFYIDPDTGKTEPHANFEPFIDNGIVALDACVPYSGKINVKVLEYEDID